MHKFFFGAFYRDKKRFYEKRNVYIDFSKNTPL